MRRSRKGARWLSCRHRSSRRWVWEARWRRPRSVERNRSKEMNSRPPARIATLLALVLTADLTGVAQTPAWQDPSGHQAQFVTVEKDVRLEVLDWGGTGRA